MVRTLIGAAVSRFPATPIVNRTCSDTPLWCEEQQMVTDGAPAGWHYGAGRNHYNFMNEALTVVNNESKTRISGHSRADFENNRLPIITTKSAGATWAQVAAGAEDAFIDARGAELKLWQDAHRGLGKWGATFVWTFHHEPNNDSAAQGGTIPIAAANWRAATQRIYERWVAQGVTIWVGEEDWTTHTEGMILSVNLIDGGAAGARGADKGVWWGPTNGNGAGNAWMDAHCLMYATDPYPGASTFLPMSWLMETTQGGTVSIKTWSDNKHTYQNSQGRVFLPGIFETGVKILSQYTNFTHASWVATGLSPTEANWIINMRDYFRDDYPEMNVVCYWDDRAVGFYDVDSTPAKWAAVVSTFTDTAAYASGLASLPDKIVTAPLIDRTPTLGVPTIFTNRLDLLRISPAPGLFLANIQMSIALPDHLDYAGEPFAPTIGQAQNVYVGLLDNSATLQAPAANSAELVAGLIDDTYTTYAPNIQMSAAVGLLDQTATLSPPAINNGGGVAAVVTPSLIDQTPVLNTPKMNQSIAPSLITGPPGGWGDTPWGQEWGAGSNLYAPSIAANNTFPLINQTATLAAPTITRQMAPSLIDQTAVLYPPAILATTAGQLVEPGLIDQTGATFDLVVDELEVYIIKLKARYTTSIPMPGSYKRTNRVGATNDSTIRLKATKGGAP
jgi:hypothetical protein